MYAQFEQFSSLDMSNESSIFIIDKEKDSSVIQVVDVCPRLSDEENDGKKKEVECVFLQKELKMSSVITEVVTEVDDENDGFQTPTSIEHKISVVQQCPPAPRKPKSLPSRKRKACFNLPCVHKEFLKKIEMLFPPTFLDELSCKIKKAKTSS